MARITRTPVYVLTAAAAALYVALGVVFADDLFNFDNFWDSEAIAGTS